MKILKSILIAVAILSTISAAASPKREFRSVWIAAMGIDWPLTSGTSASSQTKAKAEMIEYLDNFKKHNFTGVCVHVRPLADALYKSSYEPWSASVSGTRGVDPGWDPLAFVVEECHKRGLECYAWVNPFRINHQGKTYTTPQDLEWREKGWELVHGKWTIFNPAIPEARQHVLNVIKEIYSNYQIDGMLFDDYFYGGDGTPTDNTAGDWAQYTAYKSANNSNIGIADWRRMNVNTFIEELYDMIQTDRPDMRFGISPAGVGGASASKYGLSKPNVKSSDWMYDKIYCDPLAWLNDGTIDFISPQIYWQRSHSTAPYEPLAEWWSMVANHFGRHNYISAGSYKIVSDFGGNTAGGGWAEMSAQIDIAREQSLNNAPGQIYYSAKYIDGPSYSGLGDYIYENNYQKPALVPVVDWKGASPLPAPASTSFEGFDLSWSPVEVGEKTIVRYTIYAIPYGVEYTDALAADGDGIDVKYLCDISYETTWEVPEELREQHWFAICTYDGYGYESTPATVDYTLESSGKPQITAPADGSAVNWETRYTWTEVAGATYKVEVATDADFKNVFITLDDLSTCDVALDLSDLEDNTLCYWRVTAYEPKKLGTPSDVVSFRSPIRTESNKAELLTPAQGEQLDAVAKVVFSWGEVAYADDYRLEIFRVDNLEYPVYSASFSSTLETMRAELPATALGLGEFRWRISAFGKRILPTYSDDATFSITQPAVGTFEQGYSVKTDNTEYANIDELKLESLWMRSTDAAFGNIAFEANGAYNRGMVATEDYIYVSGRSADADDADIYLRQYNAHTGEHVRDITLSDEGKVRSYPCNDVIKDSKGNICIVNFSNKAIVRPMYIHLVDLATGNLTEVACVKGSKVTVTEMHTVSVYGDVTTGNFVVYGAVAYKNIIQRWTIAGGVETQCDFINLTEIVPSTAKNLGKAPRVVAIDENRVYVDGSNTAPFVFDFSTESIVSSIAEEDGTVYNGAAYFALNGKNYFAYSLDNPTFLLNKVGTSHDLTTLSKLWTLPSAGLGSVDSATNTAPVDVVVKGERTANIYVYCPGNGLAAYRITDLEGASIEDVELDEVEFVIDGLTIRFAEEVDATACNLTGAIVATAEAATQIELPSAGIYVVTVAGKSQLVSVK